MWAVEVEGGKESADALAEKYNFENKGQVSHATFRLKGIKTK